MDYKKLYDNLIDDRKSRIQDTSQYHENHHILPRSLGGSNKNENLISLTPKEHFIAHLLLFKFSTGKDKVKMGYALHMMMTAVNEHQDKRRINSRKFSKLKLKIYKEIIGEKHPNFGVKMSPEFKDKMRQVQLGEKNSMYGKIPWNKGKTKENNEIIRRLSETLKINPPSKKPGRKKYISGDLRKKCSEISRLNYSKAKKGQIPWNKGIKNCYQENVLMRMSQKRRGIIQKKIQCPHCGKVGGTTMYRWHFDNCKMKGNVNERC